MQLRTNALETESLVLYNYTSKTRLFALILFVSSVLSFQQAFAQNVTFKIMKMDAVYADALQQRLISGGTPAVDAIQKVDGFIQNGKVELMEDVSLRLEEGKIAEASSSKEKIKPKMSSSKMRKVLEESGWVLNRGLNVKMTRGSKDLLIYEVSYLKDLGEQPNIYRVDVSSEVIFSNTAPLLLQRWEDDTGIYLLTLESDEYTVSSINESVNFYIRMNYHDSESAARSGNQPIASILSNCTSGRLTTCSITRMAWYFESPDDQDMSALELGPSSRILFNGRQTENSVRLIAKYCHLEDGKVRNERGARIPKFSRHATDEDTPIQPATAKHIPLVYEASSSIKASEAADWYVTIEHIQ